ncbi:MAG: N-6 DNA methylase [Lentisphaeria bacterium]|nr:N-6 DNA methylase [Lentisphaeria bacterium]
MNISQETFQNWQRLGSDTKEKLQKGANKSRSLKKILPVEYIRCRESIELAARISDYCAAHDFSCGDVLFSLAVKLLEQKGLIRQKHVQAVLDSSPYARIPLPDTAVLPEQEQDILGFIYQCLLTEGEKNQTGSYYTPPDIVRSMLPERPLADGETFCDPCCGSGAFLLAAPVSSPLQLWGCDKDPRAVLIAKVNLLCQYPHHAFSPQIFCCDYLEETPRTPEIRAFFKKRFDLIATNPPWGAAKNKTKESFSLFFRKAAEQTKPEGRISFLLPESLLRIKAHAPLRRFILEHKLEKITFHSNLFSGVMTKACAVEIRKAPPAAVFEVREGKNISQAAVREILENEEQSFLFLSPEDKAIISRIKQQKNFFLNSRCFALGIVTGDNKNKVKSVCEPGMEAVLTGKEIRPYTPAPPEKYLHYHRETFQQTADDACYRAPEKLLYKFVSDTLVFAYDDTGALVLNSANILIPEIPGMSIKTVLAFLNSRFLRYYYRTVFKDIKILKSNLMQLPFPEISPETAERIDRLTEQILAGSYGCHEELQNLIYSCYQLSPEQIAFVERAVPDKGRWYRGEGAERRLRYLSFRGKRGFSPPRTPPPFREKRSIF